MIEQIKAEIHKMIANSIVQHLAGVWEMYETEFSASNNLKNEAIDVLISYLNSKKQFSPVQQESVSSAEEVKEEMSPIEDSPHAT